MKAGRARLRERLVDAAPEHHVATKKDLQHPICHASRHNPARSPADAGRAQFSQGGRSGLGNLQTLSGRSLTWINAPFLDPSDFEQEKLMHKIMVSLATLAALSAGSLLSTGAEAAVG